jgi:hypothetical protein
MMTNKNLTHARYFFSLFDSGLDFELEWADDDDVDDDDDDDDDNFKQISPFLACST